MLGDLDELRIWNHVRTSEQIEDSSGTPLSGVEEGLVGYYRFNESSGLTVIDSSGNAAHGTLAGGLNIPTRVIEDPLFSSTSSVDVTTVDNSGTIVGLGSRLELTRIESVTIETGDSDDTFTLNGSGVTGEQLAVVLLGGAGSDSFVVNSVGAGGAILDGQNNGDQYNVVFGSLAGIVSIVDAGLAGEDLAEIAGTDTQSIYTLTASQITSETEKIQLSESLDGVTLTSGNHGGGDEFHVQSLAVPTTVQGGRGDDSFFVSSDAPTGSGTLDAINAGLTIDGGQGANSLNVSDRGNTSATSGTLTDTRVTGLGLAADGVTYSRIGQLEIELGTSAPGHDFEIESLGPLVSATVTGGAGNDEISLGLTREILGNLTIDGADEESTTSSLDVRGDTNQLVSGDSLSFNDSRFSQDVSQDVATDYVINASRILTGSQRAGSFLADSTRTTDGRTQNVEIVNGFAYVADGGDGLRILDLSDPTNVTQIGQLEVSDVPGATFFWDVTIDADRNLAYAADDGTGVILIDISDPTSPVELAKMDFADQGTAFAIDVTFRGETLLVSARSSSRASSPVHRVYLLDVSTPDSPVQLGAIDLTNVGSNLVTVGSNLVTVNDLLYVANDEAVVTVFDISDPTAPFAVTQPGATPEADRVNVAVDVGGAAQAISVIGDIAYVAAKDAGLQILDLTDPRGPVVVGRLDTASNAVSLAVSGSTVV